MRALVYDLSIPRYVAALATQRRVPSLLYGRLAALQLREVPEPALPGPDWVSLRPRRTGLCGSDLGAIFYKMSPTMSVFASLPAVLGHEILADVVEVGAGAKETVKAGDRVVVDPVLSCLTRGMAPCRACAAGAYGRCERHSDGRGALLGFSKEFPGGFSERIVAHKSQVFVVPGAIDDDVGVLTEPAAVSVHGVMTHPPGTGESILVIGGGMIAFTTLWALKQLHPSCRVALFATEAYQLDVARALGADVAFGPGDLLKIAASDQATTELKPVIGRGLLVRGYDRVFDCIGSPRSLDDALRVTAPGGTIVLVGAAGEIPKIDLSPIWAREIRLEGTAYYGHEELHGQRARTFAITLDLLASQGASLGALVTHRLPLERYGEAIRVSVERAATRSVKAVLVP
jgi:threonine dehydrogenase-like Zn-dependent dehydrogenase